MKKLIVTLLLVTPFLATSQIVYSDGKININEANNPYRYSMAINDSTGLYWTSGKDKFFQLDLSGDKARIASHSNISFYDPHKDNFNSIEIAGVKSYSWNKEMSTAGNLSVGLEKILKLKPVTYLLTKSMYDSTPASFLDEAQAKPGLGDLQNPGILQDLNVGFKSDELASVIPGAVSSDNNGHDFIDYSVIIAYMVKSIQELNQIVEQQAKQIDALTSGSGAQNVRSRISARIAQCSPNPTLGLISIYLEIDDTANSAELRVSSVTGNVEMSQSITPDEKYVDMDLSHLTSGVHVLSLYVDGSLADSIQIIKE